MTYQDDVTALQDAVATLKQANGDAVLRIADLEKQIAALGSPDTSAIVAATTDVLQQADVLATAVKGG